MRGEISIYCLSCKRKIELDEMEDIFEFTLGNIIKGKFYGCQRKYLHKKCSVLQDSEIFNPSLV